MIRSADDRPWRSIRDGSYPGAAHAKTRYNGRWFWIDNADLESKRAFVLLLTLLTLTDRGENDQEPLLTIPG